MKSLQHAIAAAWQVSALMPARPVYRLGKAAPEDADAYHVLKAAELAAWKMAANIALVAVTDEDKSLDLNRALNENLALIASMVETDALRAMAVEPLHYPWLSRRADQA